MEPTAAKRGQKRVNVPSGVEQKVVDLTVELLIARSGTVFGRGFRLRAIGQRLYVQLSGLKVPLHLSFDCAPMEVQERGLELRAFLLERDWVLDTEAWRDACLVSRVRKGKPKETRLGFDEVVAKWHRLKTAEGINEATFQRHYLIHLRRLDARHPLSDDSLLPCFSQHREGLLGSPGMVLSASSCSLRHGLS